MKRETTMLTAFAVVIAFALLRQSMIGVATAAIAVGMSLSATAAPIVFQAGGSADPASIQATVNSFRAALGNPNHGNDPGPIVGGRREINWDGGGGNSATAASVTPFDVFLNSRGARFTTLGTELTQAPRSADPTLFPPGGLAGRFSNPTYGTTFGTFSPLRLFVPVGSNITDGVFFIPGTAGADPAVVGGFGAVFTDVDLPDSTQIEFFGGGGNLLFQAFVPIGTTADASLSFLGVLFDAGELISRVRITTGNAALGPNDGGGVDVVAMDDFLYSEPVVVAVPEPRSLALFGGGVALLLLMTAVRRQRGTP